MGGAAKQFFETKKYIKFNVPITITYHEEESSECLGTIPAYYSFYGEISYGVGRYDSTELRKTTSVGVNSTTKSISWGRCGASDDYAIYMLDDATAGYSSTTVNWIINGKTIPFSIFEVRTSGKAAGSGMMLALKVSCGSIDLDTYAAISPLPSSVPLYFYY